METDRDLFVDAMGNLIQNAVKYTSSGFVRVEGRADGDMVLFRVIDSGSGISDQQKGTLFRTVQPGEAGGVGIGLLIVRRAVTALGGTLGLESGLGGGSLFWLRLPRVVTPKN